MAPKEQVWYHVWMVKRESLIKFCTNCNVALKHRFKIKFCSNKCQHDYQYKVFVEKWKNGLVEVNVGITTKVTSAHVRRYLFEKYSNQCSQCGWNKKNPISGKIPLEIDHIDGNSENSAESNLRLLCPNCHSLTPYFRNLNKGNGRKWRMDQIHTDQTAASRHISF